MSFPILAVAAKAVYIKELPAGQISASSTAPTALKRSTTRAYRSGGALA
jgi:cytoskeletal protein RodZ